MRGLAKIGIGILIGLTAAGCASGPQADRMLHPDVLAKADLQYYWKLPLQLRGGESVVRLYLLDETLYCMTDRNRAIAVDAAMGRPLWSYDVAPAGEKVFPPCHAAEALLTEQAILPAAMRLPSDTPALERYAIVAFNTIRKAVVLNRATGAVLRELSFPFVANTGGATNGQSFFVGSGKGWCHAFSLMEGVSMWDVSTDDMLASAPKCYLGLVYLAGQDGYFYCFDSSQKPRRVFRQKMQGPVTAEIHVSERGCYVPSEDFRLYAYEPGAGTKLWEPFVCQGPLRQAVQVSSNTVYQYAEGDRFYAINLVDGQKRWDTAQGRLVLAAMEGNAYVLTAGRDLRIVNEILGTVKHSLPMTGWELFAPNTHAPAIYVATADGQLACIRLLGAGHLTPDMIRGPR